MLRLLKTWLSSKQDYFKMSASFEDESHNSNRGGKYFPNIFDKPVDLGMTYW